MTAVAITLYATRPAEEPPWRSPNRSGSGSIRSPSQRPAHALQATTTPTNRLTQSASSGSRRVSRRDPLAVCRTSIVPPWQSSGTGSNP